MSDRELLELAAKAAGVRCFVYDGMFGPEPVFETEEGEWNPLIDDGDALRLAVELGIAVELHPHWTYSATRARDWNTRFEVAHRDDKFAATRRAIVCAAAEIGKAML